MAAGGIEQNRKLFCLLQHGWRRTGGLGAERLGETGLEARGRGWQLQAEEGSLPSGTVRAHHLLRAEVKGTGRSFGSPGLVQPLGMIETNDREWGRMIENGDPGTQGR